MKVFVTGGNGFIGSAVVRTLLTEGHSVRCLVRRTSRTDRLDGLVWERVEGDIRDAASLRDGLKGCEGAVHLASPSSWNDIDSPLMDAVVRQGTRNLLDAALSLPAAGRPRVVFVSSILAVNGSEEPQRFDESASFQLPLEGLNYSRCKLAAEAMCRQVAAAGLPTVVVNPAEVYGPGDRDLITACNLLDFARSSHVFVCRGGTSIVYLDDVALGIVRALEKGRSGERYILGGDNVSVRQLARLTLELLGQRRTIVPVPNRIIKRVTTLATCLHLPLPYNRHVIPYATKFWFMDSRKAQRALGLRFRSARETLAPTLRWLRESGHLSRAA